MHNYGLGLADLPGEEKPMTEISPRHDIGRPFDDQETYGPDALECRAPEPTRTSSPAARTPASAAASEPATPGTAELVKACAALLRATANGAAEPGGHLCMTLCSAAASLVPGPAAKIFGPLACAMVCEPAPDLWPPRLDPEHGAAGVGAKDPAAVSGSGGTGGK
jgi:hypothetical protein